MQNKKDLLKETNLLHNIMNKLVSPVSISIIYFICSITWIALMDVVTDTVPTETMKLTLWIFRLSYIVLISIIIFLLVSKAIKQIHDKKSLIDNINQELEDSFTLLSGILESSPEIIVFALDSNYRYTAFNKLHQATMYHIWGIEIQTSTSMLDYIGSSIDREKAKINFDRALSGESFSLEEEYGDETFARKYYKNYYSPIISKEGVVIGLTCYVIDISHEKSLETENEYLIYHDEMTGLYNRRYYRNALQKLNHDDFLPTAIIMCDVNGLKLINDAFGHHIGDELLKTTAEILLKYCKEDEIVVRWGGDEFLIVMPNSNNEDAVALIDQIKEECLRNQIKGIDVSISFGVATQYHVENDVRGVLKLAEDQMYRNKIIEGKSMRSNALGTIMTTLHERCPREKNHSLNVGDLCCNIGAILADHKIDSERLQLCGFMHDIGKIIIEESILNKPAALTNSEYDLIKQHSEVGCRILNASKEMEDIAEAVLHHHERWDGRGYPKGLTGESIPIYSRIISIAEAFDTMTSIQPYKTKSTVQEAAEEIRSNAGTQFDPYIAKLFIEQVLGLAWNSTANDNRAV